MEITKENIFDEARKGNLDILRSPLVGQVRDRWGKTPLHWLARYGKVEVLNHTSVDQVKDVEGQTPLHQLAREGIVEVLSHPSVNQVKDGKGWTPLHDLAWRGKVEIEDLKEKYPWFKFKKDQEVSEALLEEILTTPMSVRFILED